MAIIKHQKNTKVYDPDEKFWDQVDQQTHYLIADILQKKLPLTNLRKKENLDLEKDADYRTLLLDYQEEYGANLPNQETVVNELVYEYLLEVSKSLLRTLSDFTCHDSEYFKNLT